MKRVIFHAAGILLLTLLTQLGGLAWLISLAFRRRILVFLIAYSAFSISAMWIAPVFGRVPLPCFERENFQMQSGLYCLLNRQYVVPELETALYDFAHNMQAQFPGTTTLALDANFPFITGFPLLPHLSHNDGRKVDLAFFYQNEKTFLPKSTRSPVGYFAFESGPTNCPQQFLTLRWDFAWLQPLWHEYELEPARMKFALELLVADARISKIFIEPHLADKFGVQSSKIRFQGCQAARHDDHIHIQL